jgi:hypothetical protein
VSIRARFGVVTNSKMEQQLIFPRELFHRAGTTLVWTRVFQLLVRIGDMTSEFVLSPKWRLELAIFDWTRERIDVKIVDVLFEQLESGISRCRRAFMPRTWLFWIPILTNSVFMRLDVSPVFLRIDEISNA